MRRLIKNSTVNILHYIKYNVNNILEKNKNFFLILNYHQISDNFDPKFHSKGTWLDTAFFKRQLNAIIENFRIVPLIDGIEKIENGELTENIASLTFDDGDISIKNIIPLLKQYNIPATFFINSATFDGNAGLFHIYQYLNNSPEYRHLLNTDIQSNYPKLRYTKDKKLYNKYRYILDHIYNNINKKEPLFVEKGYLSSLDQNLFHIGLHGHEHQRFSMMNYDEQKINIIKNIEILSEFKSYKPIFALPFGRPDDWDNDTIKICFENDLHLLFANGGINFNREIGYKRAISVNLTLKDLIIKNYY
ncbi:MAG: polysaccharide deacetylase family protein [Bacteroidota bacterium]|nr:polysaccharide deacetylase family protein [Bacteroidota bacterium]